MRAVRYGNKAMQRAIGPSLLVRPSAGPTRGSMACRHDSRPARNEGLPDSRESGAAARAVGRNVHRAHLSLGAAALYLAAIEDDGRLAQLAEQTCSTND